MPGFHLMWRNGKWAKLHGDSSTGDDRCLTKVKVIPNLVVVKWRKNNREGERIRKDGCPSYSLKTKAVVGGPRPGIHIFPDACGWKESLGSQVTPWPIMKNSVYSPHRLVSYTWA
jgi:hypothetical protein